MAQNNSFNMPLSIGSTRSIVKPSQICFAAYCSANVPNRTGNSVYNSVPFNSVFFNIGSHYDTGTVTFTAPVAGVYYFGSYVTFYNIGAANTNCTLALYSTPQLCDDSYSYPTQVKTPANEYTVSASAIIKMAVGNTVYCRVIVVGGTQTVGIKGLAGNSMFYGYLMA